LAEVRATVGGVLAVWSSFHRVILGITHGRLDHRSRGIFLPVQVFSPSDASRRSGRFISFSFPFFFHAFHFISPSPLCMIPFSYPDGGIFSTTSFSLVFSPMVFFPPTSTDPAAISFRVYPVSPAVKSPSGLCSSLPLRNPQLMFFLRPRTPVFFFAKD